MNKFNIETEYLETAKLIFRDSSIEKLTAISITINREQPNFTGVLLAMEMQGLDRITVEDLLESIFIVYYAQTQLHQRSISPISMGQVFKNIQSFNSFLNYFNLEKDADSSDLTQIKFLRDEVVLNFAVETLMSLFGRIENIPKEVVLGYFSLLKGIEMGAEKSG